MQRHYCQCLVGNYNRPLELEIAKTTQYKVLVRLTEQVHRAYNMALVSLCDTGLIGLILMFLSVSLSGLLFTALVWCNSHTWIYFKHKGKYVKVEDQV